MGVAKITISIESDLLRQVDYLVEERIFATRSHAFQVAVEDKVSNLDIGRFERECAKLDPVEERSFADIGVKGELEQWPEY